MTYVKNFETFIYIIDKNKDIIYIYFEKIFNDDNYIMKIDENLKLKYTEKKDEHKNEKEGETISESNNISNESKEIISSISNEKRELIIENIDSILNFSLNKEKVFVDFTNDFRKYTIKCYKKPTKENISICSKLRNIKNY